MIIRVKFTKLGYLKYLSHLDLVRLFTRAFSKADLPVKYTEGFNPHPKFSMGNPLSLGIESLAEYMELELSESMSPGELKQRLNSVLPEGIKISEAVESFETSSLSSQIRWSHYEIRLWMEDRSDKKTFSEKLEKWDGIQSIIIDKKKKKGKNKISVRVDIKPLIGNLQFKGFDDEGFAILSTLLKTGEEGNLKPSELAEAMDVHLKLGIDLEMTHITRLDVFTEVEGQLGKPI